MASKKTTELDLATIITPTDLVESVRNPSGSPASRKTTLIFGPRVVSAYATTSTSNIVFSGSGSTNITGTGAGSLVIPANTIRPGGRIVLDVAMEVVASGGGALVCGFEFGAGGSTYAQSGTHNFASGTSYLVFGQFRIQFKTVGATAVTRGSSRCIVNAVAGISVPEISASTFNTTADNTMFFQAATGSGTATLTLTPSIIHMSVFNPGQ